MNYLLGMVLGYIVHDAVQPTVVGRVLDKVSLPANTLVDATKDTPVNSTSTSD